MKYFSTHNPLIIFIYVTREGMYKGTYEIMSMSNYLCSNRGSNKSIRGWRGMVRDIAKDIMDGTWIAGKETSHKVGDGRREA